ncbi:ATP-dependent DNA helicase sgs1 [Podila clonocystis]|nr:ATP-dependent DNA helicase sgs1 [Podila clonocystis]
MSAFGASITDSQLQVIKNIGKSEDTIFVSDSRWGDNLVHFLPSLLWSDRIIVVISPYTGVHEQFSEPLTSYGIECISLGALTAIDTKTIAHLKSGPSKVVFMTPELLQNRLIERLLYSDEWRQLLLAVVFDGAHNMTIWGERYRKPYNCLDPRLFCFKSPVTYIVVSAPLPSEHFKIIKRTLQIQEATMVHEITDRSNVTLEVQRIKQQKNLLRDLDFVLDGKKTIVFFGTPEETMKACYYLRSLVPESQWTHIMQSHALNSDDHKKHVMDRLQEGVIRVLLLAEWPGMDFRNVRDVERAVLFKCPKNIWTLERHLGCVARDPSVHGAGILMVQPQPMTGVEPTQDRDLLRYIKATAGHREILNDIFDIPATPVVEVHEVKAESSSTTSGSGFVPSTVYFTLKPVIVVPKVQYPIPTAEQVAHVKEELVKWKHRVFMEHYSNFLFFTEEMVMSDETMTQLAQSKFK